MPTGAADTATPDRSHCRLLKWKVFAPGYHNRELYAPERVATVPANFAALKGVLVPTGKLGHDRQQRLLRKIGFPNVGRITRCDPTPDGGYEIDLDGVPVDVGEVVNAGWLNTGSVELKENVRDPRDPGKKLPGDVLVAVALLGEEQPALPGMGVPRATFPDGAEVPAATRMPDWLGAMADVAREMPAEFDFAADSKTVCFSAMFQEPPVTPNEIIAALATMSPEDMAKVAAACGAPAPAPTAVMSDDGKPKEPAPKPADGEAPAWFAAFAADQKKFADEVTQRVGALEAAGTTQMSAAAEEKEKAFSAEVARVVDAAVRAGHVQPWQKGAFVTHGRSLDRTKVFSDGAAKGKTEFAAWAAALEAGNVKAFSDQVADAPKAPALPAAVGVAVRPGGVIDRLVPQYAAGIRAAAAN